MKKNYSDCILFLIPRGKQNGTKNKSANKPAFFTAMLLLALFCFQNIFAQGSTCATATSISINGTCLNGTINDNSENSPSTNTAPCSLGTFGREGWYSFTVSAGPQNIMITASASNKNLALQLISSSDGSCTGTLSNIGCANADNASDSAQTETINYTNLPNGNYWIKVVNVGNANMNLTNLCVTSITPPTNDNCTGAIALTVNPATACTTSTSGTTVNATQSQVGCTGTADDDVWYSFTATATTHTVTATPGTLSNIVLQAFSGTCAGTVTGSLGCTDATSGATAETLTLTGLTAGNTYLVRVYSSSNGSNQGTFTMCVNTPPSPPSNDDCSGAIALTVNTSCSYSTYTNANATASAGVPAPGCSTYSGGDVWFSVVVPASGEVTIDTQTGAITDSGMAWYTGTCGALTLLECDDDDSNNGLMSKITRTGMTPGTTVWVRIWEYGNDSNGTFGICASTTPVCSVPTAQPTALVLTQPSNGTINGSFTAASPTPSNYLVIYNTTGVAPSPTNGTTYSVGSAAGAGNTVADTDNNTTFSVTGLTGGTTYYFFVYAYNNTSCTGGPIHLTTTPATGNTTVPFYYCTASNSSNTTYYISGVTTSGGVANISNTGTTFSAGGYNDYTSSHFVSQYAGLNFNLTTTHPASNTYGYTAWVDWNNDGDFSDSGETAITTGYLSSPAAIGSITIPAGTPAGNYRMRIRNAYLSNPAPACGNHAYGETEDYKVTCLGPLPCSENPSAITVTVTSLTTATINWTAPASAPANGYNYYYSTSSTSPTAGTTPTGSTAAGATTVNLTGLTSATTYYIWVRSNCGGGLGQGAWVGPTTFYVPNCAVGSGVGTSALGCPSVVSGGLGLNGADPATITCTSASSCVDLEATYLHLGQTTSYTAQSIAYNPPYQFGCLANPVSVNVDDIWSPVINLPFNFCFYGTNYNQCLIGSNGVLTFDLTNNSSGGYSEWEFASSLPDTSLFKNTIFGVYHDIDPSKGGEVGWELITLNSGCRALVASWKDIPMFSSSCNSLLYTGMMVLYENTNIIEVYIQKKDVCSTWNDGNAIVGIQNATGTIATIAPNRNGLDTNWTITNEAWRFVPSGTSITTIKWFEGSGTTGPVVGTTDTINVCPATTTTYTAEVTYTLCNGGTLKETEETTVTVSNSKVWNGSVDTDWNKANNWTPSGIPTALDCIIIPDVTNDPIISGTAYTGLGYSLVVNNGAALTVNPNNNLSIANTININAGGDIILEDDASLVQTNNVANTGTAHIKRTSSPMYRLDYSYWNSPVTTASNFIAGNLTSGTTNIYKYTPTVANGNGTWTQISTTTAMDPTYGIIARAPGSFPSSGAKQTFTVNFTGTPNNGNILMPIKKGTNANMGGTVPGNTTIILDADDEWNLIGNPYPSAIDIVSFLTLPANVPVVDGTIYLWTHNTLPSAAVVDPFYGNYVYNYTANDYATVNILGGTTTAPSGGTTPTQYIASGQSFFISADDTMTDGTTANITFNNSMRVLNNNANFYRSGNTDNNVDASGFNSQRVWLNLYGSNGFSQLLVGYAEGASLNWDRGFDGETLAGNSFKFYSLGADKKLTIQGRPWPFIQTDMVPLGITATAQGNHTIGIDHFDPEFNNQNIYLEDRELNIIHDLKTARYSFTSAAGTFENRFVLRYTNNTLSTNSTNAFENSIVFYNDNKLNVKSTLEPIKEIIIYDVLGRILVQSSKVNANHFTAETLTSTQSALVVKVKLENDIVVTKKVLY